MLVSDWAPIENPISFDDLRYFHPDIRFDLPYEQLTAHFILAAVQVLDTNLVELNQKYTSLVQSFGIKLGTIENETVPPFPSFYQKVVADPVPSPPHPQATEVTIAPVQSRHSSPSFASAGEDGGEESAPSNEIHTPPEGESRSHPTNPANKTQKNRKSIKENQNECGKKGFLSRVVEQVLHLNGNKERIVR
nr:uncharacterized protein CI109_004580 [Kwoniella shandongensis]KAA5527045.1 hypothetical protein CI109_004580 [Kwoniella shandongensis]